MGDWGSAFLMARMGYVLEELRLSAEPATGLALGKSSPAPSSLGDLLTGRHFSPRRNLAAVKSLPEAGALNDSIDKHPRDISS